MDLLLNFDGFLWLLATLLPFVFLQRILHREIQAVFLLLTHNSTIAIVLFSIIFFPGVAMHELSHFIAARLLFIPTGSFSLIPHTTSDGRVVLGYVETARTDILRDSIVGAAPLIAGGLFVSYVAAGELHLAFLVDLLQNGQFNLFSNAITALPARSDFWLWFYLTFVISSTMMPSSLDRRAWLPLGVVLAGLFVGVLLVGAGSWMLDHLANPFNEFLKTMALIFGFSLLLHALLWMPFFVVRRIISRVTGHSVI